MADITALIERLVAAGADPVVAACVVAEAVVAGHETSLYRREDARREKDRERKQASRAKEPKAGAEETETASHSVMSSESADSADKGFPLSPVPPSSPPHPPNNPLTPFPLSKTLSSARGLAGDFAEFWDVYPHKVGKAAAEKAYRAALKRAKRAEIMDGLARYKRSKPPDRHWCNPATFLNQDRWQDQPSEIGKPNGKVSGIAAATHKLASFFGQGSAAENQTFSSGDGGDLVELLPNWRSERS